MVYIQYKVQSYWWLFSIAAGGPCRPLKSLPQKYRNLDCYTCYISLESYESCDSIDISHFKIESQKQVHSTSLSDHERVNNVNVNRDYSPNKAQSCPVMQYIPTKIVWLH